MKTSILARSLFAGLALIAAPLYGQDVSGEVVVRSGPVAGRVVIGDEYSSYRRPAQRGRVERYAPRIIRVERLRHHHEKHWKRGKHWKHTGYRAVIVYYVDGRYYDRADRYHPRVHEVVVYERDGRYYRDECPDRYDDD